MVSAHAQSIIPVAIIWARRSSCGRSRGWTVNPAGRAVCVSMTILMVSRDTAVDTAAAAAASSGVVTNLGPRAGRWVVSRVSANAFSSCAE